MTEGAPLAPTSPPLRSHRARGAPSVAFGATSPTRSRRGGFQTAKSGNGTKTCPRNALRILGTPGLFVRLIHVLRTHGIIHPSSSTPARTDEVRVTVMGGVVVALPWVPRGSTVADV